MQLPNICGLTDTKQKIEAFLAVIDNETILDKIYRIVQFYFFHS